LAVFVPIMGQLSRSLNEESDVAPQFACHSLRERVRPNNLCWARKRYRHVPLMASLVPSSTRLCALCTSSLLFISYVWTVHKYQHFLIMAALWKWAAHYIFALRFLSIFLSSSFRFSSPNLSGRRVDIYHTLHMLWL